MSNSLQHYRLYPAMVTYQKKVTIFSMSAKKTALVL